MLAPGMIDEKSFQVELFSYIKGKLPPESSLVDDISELLSISTDSAYRRIRGDKFMVLPELILLCQHYGVPLNELVEVADSKIVSFGTQFIGEERDSIGPFLQTVNTEMERAHLAGDASFIFIINDLNLFQLLQVPELAAFKFYFWQRSGLGSEEVGEEPFSLQNTSQIGSELVRQILSHYLKIDTSELFSSDVLASAKRQIVYYYQMGFLSEKNDAVTLLTKLKDLADHLCKQAELGRKFAYGYEPDNTNGEYLLYYNDLLTIDNIILGTYGDQTLSFLTNNLINVMKSTNRSFYDYNKQVADNLIKRSDLVSGTGERIRNQTFLRIKEGIQETIDQI